MNETIDVSFFDNESYRIKFKENDSDTNSGIQIISILCVWEFKGNSHLILNGESIDFIKGDLLISKTTDTEFEFKPHSEKTFYLMTRITGPKI